MRKKELEQMVSAGLITAEQAENIAAHFKLNESRVWRWVLMSLMVLAAGLIVAGIVMLVSANWYSIPSLLKMVVAGSALVGCWVGWARWRSSRPILSEVMGFCGAGMWLACIALYGQIFQLQNPFVEGLTLFFAGVVLIPFICRQRLLIWVVVVLSFVELSALGDGSDSPLHLLNCCPGYDHEYLGFALVLLLAVWWGLSEKWRVASARWRDYGWMAPVLLLVAVSAGQMMMYVGIPLEALKPVSCVLMGLVPVVLLLCKPRGTGWLPWCLMMSVLSLLLPGGFLCGWLKELAGVAEFRYMVDKPLPEGPVPLWVARFAGIFLYFSFALLMMFSGVRGQRMSWINISSLMVVYTAIALVADVLDSYTLSGLVLVVAGLLLLGLGVLLEKNRRRLIRFVRNSQSPSLSA